MPATHHVILDTDIGSDVDDLMALALILGTPSLELVGVTTVYGDTALRARIVARVARLTGRSFPVHAGLSTPLSGREVWWAGHEGALYDDLDAETFESDDAVGFLVDRVLARPGEIDVIAIGPLTNIAAAIERDGRFAGAVRHLWVMGGTFTDDEREHNFRSDAVAARIVFDADIPTTVTGLDVTRLIDVRAEQVERIRDSGPLGALIDAEIRQWWAFWDTQWNVPHDPVTVLTLVTPELFTFSPLGRISIDENPADPGLSRHEVSGGLTRVTRLLEADAVSARMVDGIADAAPVAER
ncbi:purine nucleosidase [Microbacterium testaceum]|uniref:nucleoside hydrolase n=1 Tax=Microbacterium testaceum TaxID=2033 RepID=UPI0027850826|nr:nucleoside hydrolase [Microbacterium testaceum]MDQ1174515.1 purine nucleosidase [Microbacterium testaceum]